MHRPFLVLTIGLFLLARVPARADDLVLDRFGEYLDSLRVQAGIPALSAVLVGKNAILWEGAFGRQDLERSIAARVDTPFHADGLTQVITASLVLRCVEEGRLSLNDRIGRFKPNSPDANATLWEILAHTSAGPGALTFAYRPERLEPLAAAVRTCTADSFRETVGNELDRLAMIDSVPGPDVINLTSPAEGIPDPTTADRYRRVLERLARPYAVDQQSRPSPSSYGATTLTPASGLIATARDLAQFDLAIKSGLLLRAETLAVAWRPPAGRDGQPLPHGLGWFVQGYNGEPIVWQFGVGENASSSLMVSAPARGSTLILLANSHGLVKPFPLETGDLTTSPFGRLFLRTFVR